MTSCNRNHKRYRGFTLVELLVVLGILSLVAGLIYAIFTGQVRSKSWQDQITEMQENLRGGMDLMISETISADSMRYIAGACDTAVSFKKGASIYTYDTALVAEADGERPALLSLRRTVDGQTVEIAANITNLDIVCYDVIGQQMGIVNSTNISDVRRADISLSAITSRKNPDTGEYQTKTLATSIYLRTQWRVSGSGCGMLGFAVSPAQIKFCDPPGQKGTVTIELSNLAGDPLAGKVKIYPKINLPLQIEGANVQNIEGVAELTVSESGTASAIINATNPSGLPAGTGVEMVAMWTPTKEDCTSPAPIITSRSILVLAGDPKNIELTLEPTEPVKACPSGGCSDTVSLTAIVTDNCTNPVSNQNVSFEITADDNFRGVIAPLSGTTNSEGKFTATYTPPGPDPYSTSIIDVKATAAAIEPADQNSATGTINLTACTTRKFSLLSPSSETLDECPMNERTVSFKLMDTCNNIVKENQTAKISVTTNRGTMLNPDTKLPATPVKYDSGTNVYSTLYRTPDACGAGGNYTITISHTDIASPQTINLTLDKCPVPGVSLSVSKSTIPAGCPEETATATATIFKVTERGTCEPDPVSALVTFEVRNETSNAGYGNEGIRNGRFENNRASITKTSSPSTFTASAELNAGDSIVNDQLYIHGRAKIETYGGAEYLSNEYNVGVTESTASGDFYTDGTYAAAATYYNPPAAATPVPVYVKVQDCDSNMDLLTAETVEVTLRSERTGDIETLSLTETNLNTGRFTGTMDMVTDAPVPANGKLSASQGDKITMVHPEFTKEIYLTGCRSLKAVDALGAEMTAVTPDVAPYDGAYPDGPNAFHLNLGIPTGSVGGKWSKVHVCSNGDEDTVDIKESAAPGTFIINSVTMGRDYVYVGEGEASPAPGGNGNIGLRVARSPSKIKIIYPNENATCDSEANAVKYYGCFAELDVKDVDPPTGVIMHLPLDGALINNDNVLVEFSADDGEGYLSSVVFYLKKATSQSCLTLVDDDDPANTKSRNFVIAPGTHSVTNEQRNVDITDLGLTDGDGFWRAFVVAVDDSNNETDSNKNCVTRDKTVPVLNIDKPVNNQTITGNSVDFEFGPTDAVSGIQSTSVTLLDSVGVVVGGPSGLLSGSFSVLGYTDGIYRVQFEATDKAGNTATETRTIKLNRLSVTINAPLEGATVSDVDVPWSFTYFDGGTVTAYTVELVGQVPIISPGNPNNSSGTITNVSSGHKFDSTLYVDGDHVFKVTVQDNEGNILSATRNITVKNNCYLKNVAVYRDTSQNAPPDRVRVSGEFIRNGSPSTFDITIKAQDISEYTKNGEASPFAWTSAYKFGKTDTIKVEVQAKRGKCTAAPVIIERPAIYAADSGWYDNSGSHGAANQNFLVGAIGSTRYRNFFVLNIPNITDEIVGATLSIQNPAGGGYTSPDATETWELYDVTTPIATLTAGGAGLVAIFDDLGGGTTYGSASVSAASDGKYVNVVLNASAIAALNAARGGQIAIGGRLGTLNADDFDNEFCFGYSSEAYIRLMTLGVRRP